MQKTLKIFSIIVLSGLLLLGITPLKVNSASYNPTNDKTTDLGHNVVMHETIGTFQGSQYINYVVFNPVTTKSIKLIPWAVLNQETQTNIRSSVLNIAKDYEAKNPGSKVIAGINADFFPFVQTNENPFSAQVIDGNLHQGGVFTINQGSTYYPANVLGIYDDGTLKSSHNVYASNATFLDIFDERGTVIYSTQLSTVNSTVGSGQTGAFFGTMYTKQLNEQEGIYYVQSPSYVRDDNKFARGVISSVVNQLTMAKRTVAIVTKDAKVKSYLKEGVEIRVTKRLAGELEGAVSAIGFYGHPLQNGVVPSYGAYPNGLGGPREQSVVTSANPRTMLGVKEDDTVIMGIVEGRATGKTGLTGQGVGEFLKQFGCIEGFNFDGGGSSTLVARVNGTLKQVATGTDGTRAVVNALLLVEQETDPIELNPVISEIKHNSFKITVDPKPNGNQQIQKIEAVVNDEFYTIENNTIVIEDAKVTSSNTVRFKVTYTENGTSKSFSTLKTITVKTVALPPEVSVEVREITTSSVSFNVTLNTNGSTIIEAYFVFGDNHRVIIPGQNILTFQNLKSGNTYKYSSIVNYNDETGSKYYTFPETSVQVKKASGCGSNAMYIYSALSTVAITLFLVRRKKNQ
jgi:hypothetical protein